MAYKAGRRIDGRVFHMPFRWQHSQAALLTACNASVQQLNAVGAHSLVLGR